MNSISVTNTRNFAILGHSGCGKTTLADALLHKLGENTRRGSVDDGSSMADHTDAEKNRRITIQCKPFSGVYKSDSKASYHIVFCDTPGYMDFYGQVIAATRVCDFALIVIDGSSGIQVGTNKVWQRVTELGLPAAIMVTGLDRDNADFKNVFTAIQDRWGSRCAPVVVPVAGGSGVASVLSDKLPDDVAAQVEAARGSLIELAAETDDSLIEKYLGGESLSASEIASGLRSAVQSCQLVPVFACMPTKDVGLTELVEGIIGLMPSPEDRGFKDASGNDIDPSPNAPFVGFIWKTLSDAFIGQLTFVRVLGGTLESDSEAFNVANGEKERIAQLLVINGKEQKTITKATAGDIIGLTKLKSSGLNDVLCSAGHKVVIEPLKFPNSLMSLAVRAKTRGDEDKIGVALNKLATEDPTIRVERNNETHEMLLSGMGDVHLDVAVEQMKSRSNVDVVLSTPKVPYRETVTALAEGHHKHKKQTGGHGQYGEVYLRVEPKRQDEEDWFVNAIVGGAIPTNYIPAVQKGLVEGMTQGAVAGYPVTGVKVTIHDGSFHEVDSSEVAFKIAASRALKDAMSNAKPVLLEPIMQARISVPDRFVGDVAGTISHKRGRVLGMESQDGVQIIIVDVPLAEMVRYCAELRSMTSGEGTFDLTFSRYEIVPSNIAQKIVDAAAKEKEEEG